MLYIFHGTDTEVARAKVHALIDGLLAKSPDAALFRFEAEEITTDRLVEYSESQGLFAQKYIVFLDHPFETKESEDVFVGFRKELAESENIFIVLTGPLTKTVLKKFEKHATQIVEVGAATQSKTKDEFNMFTMTDALAARQTGKLWVLYQRALRAGKSPEEIHGVLWWQIKSLLLAARSEDAKAAGLKPFVFTKAKRAVQNFDERELTSLSQSFIDVYHKARRGDVDFRTFLETQILSL